MNADNAPLPRSRSLWHSRHYLTFETPRLSQTFPGPVHISPYHDTSTPCCCITNQASHALFPVLRIPPVESHAGSGPVRSEERRVGKEGRCRRSLVQQKTKK